MLGDRIRPLQASCPTANCTWPITPSIGVCGACAESKFQQIGCNASCSADNFVCRETPNDYCNYTLSGSGETVQLYDFLGKTVNIIGVGFHVVPCLRCANEKSKLDNRSYITTFELFGVPFDFKLPAYGDPTTTTAITKPKSIDLEATQCSLWFCVQAWNTSVAANVQHDEISGIFDISESKDDEALFKRLPIPQEMDPDGLTNFTVFTEPWGLLQILFEDALRGNVSISTGAYDYSNDLINGAWKGSANASA